MLAFNELLLLLYGVTGLCVMSFGSSLIYLFIYFLIGKQ